MNKNCYSTTVNIETKADSSTQQFLSTCQALKSDSNSGACFRSIKNICLLIAVCFSSNLVKAQSFIMTSGGTATTCTGTFYDSQGAGVNYGTNDNFTYQICSSIPNNAVQLYFDDAAAIGNGMGSGDSLKIYDGNSVAAPLLGVFSSSVIMGGSIRASACNASGCLTVEIITDGVAGTEGRFEAIISCGFACQSVLTGMDPATPIVSTDGNLYICPETTVQFTADPVFPQDNCLYDQDAANCTYQWDFDGDGVQDATGQTASYGFLAQVSHDVMLTITDQFGCRSYDRLPMKVAVATRPEFHGLNYTDPICFNQVNTISIDSVITVPYSVSYNNEVAGSLPLPDNQGTPFISSVQLNAFLPNSTITSINDINEVCFELEHSYVGDLQIVLVCPNGQSMVLLEYPNSCGSWFFGHPVDMNSDINIIGERMWYCFSPSATQGTFSDVASGGPFYTADYTDQLGQIYTGTSFFPPSMPPVPAITPPGGSPAYPYEDYEAFDPWTNLVGCPLNGQWSIEITDNLSIDNGFSNGWYIDFEPTLLADTIFAYEPTIVDSGWVTNPSFVNTYADSVTILATTNGGTMPVTYSVTDDFGCTWDTTISFTVTPSNDPGCRVCFDPIIESNSVACFGEANGYIIATAFDSLDLSPKPYDFLYQDFLGNTIDVSLDNQLSDTLFGLLPGTYTIIMTDSNDCSKTVQTTIASPDELISFIIQNNATSCVNTCDGKAKVGVTGGTTPYAFLWDDGSVADSSVIVCAGNNLVEITDGAGCLDSIYVNMQEPNKIVVVPSGDDTICVSNSATLWVDVSGGNGGYSFVWSTNQMNDTIVVTPIGSKTYSVTVSDNKGCRGDTIFTVLMLPPLQSFLNNLDTICREDSLILNASAAGGDGNYLFQWAGGIGNTSSIVVKPLLDQTYTVTISDGCNSPEITSTTLIRVGTYPVFVLDTKLPTGGCTPHEVTFDVDTISPLIQYSMSFGDGLTLPVTQKTFSHLYDNIGCNDVTFSATSAMGCVNTTTYTCEVNVYPNPVADFILNPNRLTTVNNVTTVVDLSSGAIEWNWDFGDDFESNEQFVEHMFKDSGTYIVQLAIKNVYGCPDTTQQAIFVEFETTIYVPNAFSPNDDGYNDFFQVYGNGIILDGYDFKVFNRWGNMVYNSISVDDQWDGTYLSKGTFLQSGIYPYILIYQGVDQLEKTQMGHIFIKY